MPKRPFSVGLTERLQDPAYIAEYLNSALEDSGEAFLLALRDVAEAQSMAKLAKASQLDRVNLYRMLSEKGNPRLSSLSALLDALGLEIKVVEESKKTTLRTNCSEPNQIAYSWVAPHEAMAADLASNTLVQGKAAVASHGSSPAVDGNTVGKPLRKFAGREMGIAAKGLLSHSAYPQDAANY